MPIRPRISRSRVTPVQVDDPQVAKAIDAVRSAILPNIFSDARALEDVQFTSGVTKRLAHGLGRKPQGYMIARIDRGAAMAYHYDEQRQHADTSIYLYLRFEGISPIATIVVW